MTQDTPESQERTWRVNPHIENVWKVWRFGDPTFYLVVGKGGGERLAAHLNALEARAETAEGLVRDLAALVRDGMHGTDTSWRRRADRLLSRAQSIDTEVGNDSN